jgi:hypothetical protein
MKTSNIQDEEPSRDPSSEGSATERASGEPRSKAPRLLAPACTTLEMLLTIHPTARVGAKTPN